MPKIEAKERLILALDVPTLAAAERLRLRGEAGQLVAASRKDRESDDLEQLAGELLETWQAVEGDMQLAASVLAAVEAVTERAERVGGFGALRLSVTIDSLLGATALRSPYFTEPGALAFSR